MSAQVAAAAMVMLAVLVTIGWVMYLVAETSKRQRQMKARAELQGRLLDKFSSATEVVEFLQTPGGARFIESPADSDEKPSGGILRSVHRGIILLAVGLGCLGLTVAYGWQDNPLLVIGVILVCLGIGFLVSAAVSRQLAKALGIADSAASR